MSSFCCDLTLNNLPTVLLLCALTVILSTFPKLVSCHQDDEYVDFTDMGSYDHGMQVNKIIEDNTGVTVRSITTEANKGTLMGINVENGSRPMKFLQRVVKSILRQMNVQSHTFGPGEAITIDLQAEIKYNDYVILNKFVNSEEEEEPDKYLKKVDDIMSNLIHVVEHSGSRFDYMEFILNLPIFSSLKFWLVVITMLVVCFLVGMLSLRAVHAVNNVSMLFYGFLIIFILSCIWTFSYMYEDAKATNYAKLVQAQNPPKDCEYENLNFRDSISYFFRVQLFGYKDQCEQYYSTTMTDPFWSVNPLEAISKSFSVLVFAPFGYIGDKLGLFFGGIISGIPFWLQPLLVLLIFGFTFMSLFGYRVVSPLFTIEPARREYLNQGPPTAAPSGSPAIADRIKNELVERPERKVMKSIRDAQTDMDGFENYLDGIDESSSTGEASSSRTGGSGGWWWPVFWIFHKISQVWEFIVHILDVMLRQFPTDIDQPPLDHNDEDDDDNSFNFNHHFQNQNQNQRVPTPPPPPRPPIPRERPDRVGRRPAPTSAAGSSSVPQQQRQSIQIEDVLIPRRRMHIGFERSSSSAKEEDKENMKPCSSSSLLNSSSNTNNDNSVGTSHETPAVLTTTRTTSVRCDDDDPSNISSSNNNSTDEDEGTNNVN